MTSYHEKYGLPSFDTHLFVVFGYGSILWKQNFEFVRCFTCYVTHYERLFYQGSRDHRGTPERPGRVVTLLPARADRRVYGKAFLLPEDPARVDAVFDNLDVREQGGYERVEVTLYDKDTDAPLALPPELNPRGKPVVWLCYNATPSNADYLGPADAQDEAANYHMMAAQIHASVGPSGPNTEYLFNLAESLRQMGVPDPHVERLEREVRALGD